MNRYVNRSSAVLVTLSALFMVFSCATAPSSQEGKAELRRSSADVVERAQRADPTLYYVMNNAEGYAVFPEIGKGAIGVGGAYGRGDVYENGRMIGYCDLTQGSIGFQLGGQSYSEILVFEDQDAMDSFKAGRLRFDAQATAVAIKSGAGANARFANGVQVFTMNEEGLMYEASVGGQQFTFQGL